LAKIRAGIIGQGKSGFDIHVYTMGLLPSKYKIVAVADPIPENLNRPRWALGCDCYPDYKDLLKRSDLDLVVNATPSLYHHPITIEALEAGHNVLCEKPMAQSVVEVDQMIAAAKKSGKLLAIFQQSRYAPYYQQVRKVIDSGVLGRIVAVKVKFSGFGRRWDWQTLHDMGGGSLLNTGPHPLDQALGLFGRDRMPSVFCLMDRVLTFGDAEDYVKLILHGKDRPVVEVEVVSCEAYPTCTYHIQAERGGLTGSMTELDWRYYKPEELPERHLQPKPVAIPQYCSESLKWYSKKWKLPERQNELFDTMGKALYSNLHSALTKGTPLEVTPEQVRQQIAVIEECHRQNPTRFSRE
jgi:scyllo-inositol 2-dehydrogenase (NADP+)